MKSIKVFWHGKRLKDIYVGASRWDIIKYRTFRIIKVLAICLFIAGVSVGIFESGKMSSQATASYAKETIDISDKIFDSKIEKLKNDVANQLMKCESAGYSEDDGIVIFDSNAKGSFGQFQFQKDTVIHFYKLIYGKTITSKEAILIALDTEKAKKLAIDVMFTTKNKAGKDWVRCSQKYGLDEQIELIKKMEVL